jgi:hypothetical protein
MERRNFLMAALAAWIPRGSTKAPELTWTTRDGITRPISQLADDHLVNVIRYRLAWTTSTYGPEDDTYYALVTEACKRGLRWDQPRYSPEWCAQHNRYETKACLQESSVISPSGLPWYRRYLRWSRFDGGVQEIR